MSSSGAQSGGPYERPFREQSPRHSPAQGEDSELMQRVLEETMAATDGDRPMDPRELDALRGVARRHAGEALTLDPIVIDLVSAVLDSQFGKQISDKSLRRSMIVRIAETLVESPPAWDRLQSLWNRLNEATG